MQPVFVGDVQGCAAELEELLARISRRLGDDFELLAVGDLINRGPQNLRTLRILRERAERGRARVVLGNHELGFLRSALGERPVGPLDTFQEVLDHPEVDDWVDWLRRQPVVCTGRLGERSWAMVHAAVLPGLSRRELEQKGAAVTRRLSEGSTRALRRFLAAPASDGGDRDALGWLTTCRTIDGERWSPKPPEEGGGRPWHELWSAQSPDYGVVYGHWSTQGLHVAPGLRGLDTGCVHHGRGVDGFLTAWLPDRSAPDAFATPDTGFEQVRAFAKYWKD